MQEVGGSSPPVPTNCDATLGSKLQPDVTNLEPFGMRRLESRLWLSSSNSPPCLQSPSPCPTVRSTSVPGARPCGIFASALPQSVMKKALAAVVDGRMVDLTAPHRPDAPRAAGDARTARRPWPSTGTRRRICWRPRSRRCIPARSAASARRPTKGSSTTSSSAAVRA